MVFRGYGRIWHPKRHRELVNFNKVSIYETNDEIEIEILKNSPNVTMAEGSYIEAEDAEYTIEEEDNEEIDIKDKLIEDIKEKGLSDKAPSTLKRMSESKLRKILEG